MFSVLIELLVCLCCCVFGLSLGFDCLRFVGFRGMGCFGIDLFVLCFVEMWVLDLGLYTCVGFWFMGFVDIGWWCCCVSLCWVLVVFGVCAGCWFCLCWFT